MLVKNMFSNCSADMRTMTMSNKLFAEAHAYENVSSDDLDVTTESIRNMIDVINGASHLDGFTKDEAAEMLQLLCTS